jgi:biotin synthase
MKEKFDGKNVVENGSKFDGKNAAKGERKVNRISSGEIAFCGLFAALIAVGAFIKIPGPIVPFTAQFLFVNLAGILLGKKGGALAVGVYIALGLIGIPIFAEGGGIGYVLNPKFGYLIGFFVGAYCGGAVFERLIGKHYGERIGKATEKSDEHSHRYGERIGETTEKSDEHSHRYGERIGETTEKSDEHSTPREGRGGGATEKNDFYNFGKPFLKKRIFRTFPKNFPSKKSALPPYLIAGLVNISIIYFFGVIYYYFVARFYLGSANGLWFFVLNCFLVFVPTDLIWCVVSAFMAKRLFPFIKNAARYGVRSDKFNKGLDGHTELKDEKERFGKYTELKNERLDEYAELKKDGQYEYSAIENAEFRDKSTEFKEYEKNESEREISNSKNESDIFKPLYLIKNAENYGEDAMEFKKDDAEKDGRETSHSKSDKENESGREISNSRKDKENESGRETPHSRKDKENESGRETSQSKKDRENESGSEISKSRKDKERTSGRETSNSPKTDGLDRLTKKILDGYKITKDEAAALSGADADELSFRANRIREKFCGDAFDMCSIINGKSGCCSENCKFCAQSEHSRAACETYALLNEKEVVEGALYSYKKGVNRFSIVTAGRALSGAEVDAVCKSYEKIGEACGIFKCASHGLLKYEDFQKLRRAGVKRYHCNLETSRNFFPNICTTHTYDDKIDAIKAAKKAGMEVCSGGIIGLGESFSDRIDMAFELRGLEIKSVPINILNPVKGTELENSPILNEEEVRKTVALYRFILPDAALRMAGGRGLLKDKGEKIFMSGANAAATGDMLTTGGISIENDMETVKRLGYEVRLS